LFVRRGLDLKNFGHGLGGFVLGLGLVNYGLGLNLDTCGLAALGSLALTPSPIKFVSNTVTIKQNYYYSKSTGPIRPTAKCKRKLI